MFAKSEEEETVTAVEETQVALEEIEAKEQVVKQRRGAHLELPVMFSPLVTELQESQWYNSLLAESPSMNTAAVVVGRLYATLFPLPRSCKVDMIGTYIIGAGAAGAKGRIGIYYTNGHHYPNKLLLDAGEIDCTAVGLKSINIDITLKRGSYFLAQVFNDAAIRMRYPSNALRVLRSSASEMTFATWYVANPFGELPLTYPSGASGDAAVWQIMLHILTSW